MKLTPRPFQQEAHDRVIESWKRSTNPIIIEAATGAGKSVIIAMIARTLHGISQGKRVLCLAPSAELVGQNAEKYKAIGEQCSIYSASISKSLRHQVVFATEGTFKKVAERLGSDFAGVIIDECHNMGNTIKDIISDMQKGNPNLRICGLSATPYRLGSGFIYQTEPDGKSLPEEVCRDPYFYQCVYKIQARELIDLGFLTPLRAADINVSGYDTSALKVQSNGQYSNKTIKAAFEGWGRKTSGIVADIINQTQDATGVMIFAATIQHAEEVMASLHPDNARLITGKTPKSERAQIIESFKARDFMYLVNVAVLTTGFDAPNVSHVAILRATESVSLLQQIMGRAMRLYNGKQEAIILDYAGNIENHMPDGDLYVPQIKASFASTGEGMEAKCELCNKINIFSARKNDDGFLIDDYGYFLDLTGERLQTQITETQSVDTPAHYGRRCCHLGRTGEQCTYYWSCKTCPVCEHDNDIAARFCGNCKAELINPNDKLIEIHTKQRKDPTYWQCDEVVNIEYKNSISRNGNDMLVADIYTARRKITQYLLETDFRQKMRKQVFYDATNGFTELPRTVKYRKSGDFWELAAFNHPTDEEVLREQLQRS